MKISVYLKDGKDERLDEAPTLTKQHYTWFLEKFADACKKNSIRQAIYLKMVKTLMDDFAATNSQFKPEVFMTYAKKQFKADDSEEE